MNSNFQIKFERKFHDARFWWFAFLPPSQLRNWKSPTTQTTFLCFVFSAPSVECTQTVNGSGKIRDGQQYMRARQPTSGSSERVSEPEVACGKEKREKHRLNGRATVCCCENKHELSIIFCGISSWSRLVLGKLRGTDGDDSKEIKLVFYYKFWVFHWKIVKH